HGRRAHRDPLVSRTTTRAHDPRQQNSRRIDDHRLLRLEEPVGDRKKKNRECNSTPLNLDIGERPRVPAGAAWPCTTVLVREYHRKSHTTGCAEPPIS